MSTIATLFTALTAGLYCWLHPDHPPLELGPSETMKKEEAKNKAAKSNAKIKTRTSKERTKDVNVKEDLEVKKPKEGSEKSLRHTAEKKTADSKTGKLIHKSGEMSGNRKQVSKISKLDAPHEKEEVENERKLG
ncbi:hypothetical protein KIN20_032450 [Parelaphostrongylus tenuis]|uniref:Secreted protein n=1 Tax=Parelaphostrongylus tenuis TaxID=148309 RepID=A0AAD5R729_PARTN|nr:hypothetical protein KIN20_032450 [Parelaphostrongylus tenuis]